jgi:dTDP-4-amino-4,6-dideoxygalactose transaminase
MLRGAKIVFVDSRPDHPGMDEGKIEDVITPKTKVIVPVHYAGVSCNMTTIMSIANKYNLLVVEDAAQAIDSFFIGQDGISKPLGAIGHFGCFSFHETKNIQCGEGGMIAINDERFFKRSEIIWEKGTNRTEFFRGQVNKYGWVDIGSSFLPSEIAAAFLWAQLEQLGEIQKRRKEIWDQYYDYLYTHGDTGHFTLPRLPGYSTNNAHLFYLVCNSLQERDELLLYLKSKGILAVFHYQSLHKSPFFVEKHDGRFLPYSDLYSDRLVRLPLFYELKDTEIEYICNQIKSFFHD